MRKKTAIAQHAGSEQEHHAPKASKASSAPAGSKRELATAPAPRGKPASRNAETTQILGHAKIAAQRREMNPEFQRAQTCMSKLREERTERIRIIEQETHTPEFTIESGETASAAYARDYGLALRSSYQAQFQEIDTALRRISEGRYGICAHTGEPIAPERLRAIPWTRFKLQAEQQIELGGLAPFHFKLPPRAVTLGPPAEESEEPDAEREQH